MLCPFSPFHCPPVAQAKSQMPSQQWENMGFQGASAIVLNMVGRAHYETEWERQGLCSPVDDGRLHNSTSGLSLGRGYVRFPHLGFKLRVRPLLLQQETLSRICLESPSGLCVCIRTFWKGTEPKEEVGMGVVLEAPGCTSLCHVQSFLTVATSAVND